jgi:predicted outer membrane repeat protein
MRSLGVLAVLLLVGGRAGATTIDVPGSYPTITLAVANASPGDTVLVTGGPYHEWDLELPPGTTLRAPGYASVKIDALQQGRHFTLVGEEASYTIEGFLLTGGEEGAGACIHSGSSRVELTVRRCVFRGNASTGSAGAIWVNGSRSTLRIENATFEDNVAEHAAGAIWLDGQTSGSTLYVENTSFARNQAQGDAGGAMRLGARVDGTFYNVSFRDNTAAGNGGAFYASGWCDLVFQSGLFSGNTGHTGDDFRISETQVQVADSDFVGGWNEVEATSELALVCCNFLEGAEPQTWGEDVFVYSDGCDPTGGIEATPAPVALSAPTARPNPFNPRTTIAFRTSAPGHVRLEILDLRGRRIAVLVDRELGAGRHAWVWDGHDGDGRAVPSGVYLPRVVAGGRVATGRMTLAR